MDIGSLFPSTDNLFKFLFLGGLMMILTAMIYPLQKEQDRAIEVINYNEKVSILNFEISKLRREIQSINLKVNKAIAECTRLENKKKHSTTLEKRKISAQILLLQSSHNNEVLKVKDKKEILDKKIIKSNADKEKIKLLEKYVKTYRYYSFFFLLFGIPLSSVGLFFWAKSTIKSEKLITKELNRT